MRSILFLALVVIGSVSTTVSAQTLTGKVVDQNNAPIAHAKVSIQGLNASGVSTSESGEFTLTAGGNSVLQVTATGFAPFDRSVRDLPDPLVIVLQPAVLREDVVVSITRTDTRLSETPASVVVLDRQTLSTTAAQTPDDVLRQVAGFTLFRRSSSKTANPTTQGANLRGIGGSGAARTAIEFDGVSLNDAFGGWTWWSRIPRIATDRIEVLRGGASSLYAQSALSGAIGLAAVTPDSPTFRIDASAGSQGTYDGSFYAAYPIKGWTFDVAAEAFQTEGYIPVAPEDRGSADTRANSRHHSGIFTIARKFGERSRVFARGNLFAERRDNGTRLTNNGTYFRQAVLGGDITDERAGVFTIRGAVDAQVYDQTFSAVSADRNSENLTRIQRVPSRSFAASLVWRRAVESHALSAAFDLGGARGFSDETAISTGRATALISSGGQEFSYGIYAQDLWRVTNAVNLSIGARFDRWREYDASSTTRSLTGGPTTSTSFADRSEERFSPRIAALYRITPNVSAFAAFNTSFRSPSLNELYRAFRVGNVLTLANENLRAETSRTFEGGLNIISFSRRLSVRGNVFRTTVSNPVVSVTLSSAPTLITRQRQNVGETLSRGIEIDAEFAPDPKIRLSAGYLFSDSRVTEFPSNPALVDKLVPQVARSQFTFQGTYRPRNALTFSVQGRASDDQFDDDLNTFRLRPYVTLDAFASYKFSKIVEIFAAAENLLDSRYDIGLTPTRTIAAPRFARVGLRLDLSRR